MIRVFVTIQNRYDAKAKTQKLKAILNGFMPCDYEGTE